MKYAYAANRDIGVWVLEHLVAQQLRPEFLLITDEDSIERQQLIDLSGLDNSRIFIGKPKQDQIERIQKAQLDFIIGIHFPYIIRASLLEASRNGFLNLHPAYLPYNRGWHTPSWAILEGTPAGATLHFMSEEVDMGDIVHQKTLEIAPEDTANTLYQKMKKLELQVFIEALPGLINGTFDRKTQDPASGTSHRRKDLFSDEVAKLELEEFYKLEDLLNKLRALTTNSIHEACYFEKDQTKYRINISIEKEE